MREKINKLFCTKCSDYKIVNTRYINIYEWLRDGGRYHFFHYYNKGRGHYNEFAKVASILRELGLKFEMGNDAVRGGKNGAYISLDKESEALRKKWVAAGYFSDNTGKYVLI